MKIAKSGSFLEDVVTRTLSSYLGGELTGALSARWGDCKGICINIDINAMESIGAIVSDHSEPLTVAAHVYVNLNSCGGRSIFHYTS